MTTSYRADIDGLRAVAVLSVLFYHAGLGLFSGGFVGVDVFFVISGFLITRLLKNEIEAQGRIDFRNFYLRRARRLLPAFFFTLAGTSVLAVIYLSPARLEAFGASQIHAVLSISNIYFYSVSGYFDSDALLKPLLHTWSLGVEEQFYVVWPLLLATLIRRNLHAPIVILAIGVLSLCLAQQQLAAQPEAVFFLMPYRIFEFAIGAVLVWLMHRQPKVPLLAEFTCVAGLLLIGTAVLTFTEKTAFPGVYALLPCLGAALCIYAGQAPYAGWLLRNRLFAGIGLISYSLYLVHWPIIVFYQQRLGARVFSAADALLVLVASLIVALLIYICIEKPLRRARQYNTSFAVCSLVLFMSFSYVAASMWGLDGWANRAWATSGSISSAALKAGTAQRFRARQDICIRKGWAVCDEPEAGKINALILGDSHAVDALNAFQAIHPEHDYSMSTLGGCPPTRDIETMVPASHPERSKCVQLNLQRFDLAYLKRFDYIVINLLYDWYTPAHLQAYLEFLKAGGIQKVVVMGGYFVLKRDMYEVLNESGYSRGAVENSIKVTAEYEENLQAIVEGAGYLFVSKRKSFCSTGTCELYDREGVPYTYDRHHLSYAFAHRLGAFNQDRINAFLTGLAPTPPTLAASTEGAGEAPASTELTQFIWLTPQSVSSCPGGQRVLVRWDVRRHSAARTIKLWVNRAAEPAKLFLEAGAVGEKSTGEWAVAGMQFTLTDAQTGERLADARLSAQPCLTSQ
ncbi:MAG: acyltransferase family protein [Pseudomonas sp.]|uniref:acyltransferase family protein n=1 Tax=Pseudomonas sp. TaxID=306 RepID=UPI003397C74C